MHAHTHIPASTHTYLHPKLSTPKGHSHTAPLLQGVQHKSHTSHMQITCKSHCILHADHMTHVPLSSLHTHVEHSSDPMLLQTVLLETFKERKGRIIMFMNNYSWGAVDYGFLEPITLCSSSQFCFIMLMPRYLLCLHYARKKKPPSHHLDSCSYQCSSNG